MREAHRPNSLAQCGDLSIGRDVIDSKWRPRPGHRGVRREGKLTNAWIRFATSDGPPSKASVMAALAEAGIDVDDAPINQAASGGIIVFNEVTPRLLSSVRSQSRGGVDRVLLVATSEQAIRESGPWPLLEAGASDVLTLRDSKETASEIAARLSRWNEVDELLWSPLVQENLVGRSPAWISLLRQIVEVARFSDASVLITGESGTGKELVARLVHTLDPRPTKGELVILDCTTVVPTLSGSEFFGHERGAFTGAVSAREGAFAMANGGSLFLDEVGDLPLTLQAELLRVIQEGTYKPVGSNKWNKTNFRLICATNRDLFEEESHGRFRRDFYYRIAAWTCRMPPLSERREDISMLAAHFLSQLRPDVDQDQLDAAVSEFLANREYPGNVRDLRQLIARLATRHVGPGPITAGDVPSEERSGERIEMEDPWGLEHAIHRAVSTGVMLKEIRDLATDTAVRLVLDEEEGSVKRAAIRLGVTDRAIQLRRAKGARAAAHVPSSITLPGSDLVRADKDAEHGSAGG
jgi:DNA-binding NtrC family response regulator